MDSDIVERIHALVTDDSVDEAYTFTPPNSFINYMSPVHFGSLFSNSTEFPPHMSPNSCVELQQNLSNVSGDGDFFKKMVNPEARVAVKILIPSGAVGPLIGKGGFFMRTLQHECYVNICPREFAYAGSNDRVVILKGRLCSVLNVTERITSHVKERCPKANRKDVFSVEDPTSYEIRIIVPNSTVETMNDDNTVEVIRENTGCYVQLFPNLLSYDDGTVINERLLVIAHDSIVSTKQGVEILLETISHDPYHICEIAKLDHHFLRNGTKRNSLSQTPSKQNIDPSFTFPLSPNGSANLFNNNETTMDPTKLNNYVLSLVSILRAVHFTENVINEAINAVKTLAKVNALELAVSVGMQNFGLLGGSVPNNSPPNSTGAGSYVMFLQEDGEAASDTPSDTIPVNSAILDVLMNEPSVLSDGTDYANTVIEEFVFPDYVQLKIPERIVGAVIGPKARMLTEIQHFSRCRVQMERKDPVSSPDGMRLLNLFGDPIALKNCRRMMEKLINLEYRRRVLRSTA